MTNVQHGRGPRQIRFRNALNLRQLTMIKNDTLPGSHVRALSTKESPITVLVTKIQRLNSTATM